jgi:hypothetical protein
MSGIDDHPPARRTRVVLARRRNAGTRVTLLWAVDTNAVSVHVRDAGANHKFELAVEPGASAIDVFEHPYAYAAWRGVDYPPAGLKRAA